MEVKAFERQPVGRLGNAVQALHHGIRVHAETAAAGRCGAVAQEQAGATACWRSPQAVPQVVQFFHRIERDQRAMRKQLLMDRRGLGRPGRTHAQRVDAGPQGVAQLVAA